MPNIFKMKCLIYFQILVSLRSQASTISMSEIEIYVREDPTETAQTPYCNGDGAAYLIPAEDSSTDYTFDKVGYLDCSI